MTKALRFDSIVTDASSDKTLRVPPTQSDRMECKSGTRRRPRIRHALTTKTDDTGNQEASLSVWISDKTRNRVYYTYVAILLLGLVTYFLLGTVWQHTIMGMLSKMTPAEMGVGVTKRFAPEITP